MHHQMFQQQMQMQMAAMEKRAETSEKYLCQIRNKVHSVNNIKLTIIAKIRETHICSSSPRAASVSSVPHNTEINREEKTSGDTAILNEHDDDALTSAPLHRMRA